jgi:hypothetical protein
MLGLDPAIEERLQRVPVFCKQPLDEGFFRFGHDGSGYRLEGLGGWIPMGFVYLYRVPVRVFGYR